MVTTPRPSPYLWQTDHRCDGTAVDVHPHAPKPQAPETYFQAAFRVQSPWTVQNPDGDDPHGEEIIKQVCFVFDFAPTEHCGR